MDHGPGCLPSPIGNGLLCFSVWRSRQVTRYRVSLSNGAERGDGRERVDVATLRELIRNLQYFQSLRESDNLTEITGPAGVTYSIFDIEHLYECRDRLSTRQRQAIELFLYQNIRERDVARMMGVAETNPIAIYATQGLARLCEMIDKGELPNYRGDSAGV